MKTKITFILPALLLLLGFSSCDSYRLSSAFNNSTNCTDFFWEANNYHNLSDLSPLEGCRCDLTTNSFLTGLTVYKESPNIGTLNNFIARLEVDCQPYLPLYNNGSTLRPNSGSPSTDCEVFSANHDPQRHRISIPNGHVAIGADLLIGNGSKWIKDIRLISAPITVTNGNFRVGTHRMTDYALGRSGNNVKRILCESLGRATAIAGIELEYSSSNGMIRKIIFNMAELTLTRTQNGQSRISARATDAVEFSL